MITREHRGPVARMPWECTPDYEEWYRGQSHPRVQNPLYRVSPIAPPPDVDPHRRNRTALAFVRPLLHAPSSPVREVARSIFDILGGDDEDEE